MQLASGAWQEPVWEMWLKEAEGKVLLPCTEGNSCDMREEELQAALEACKLERSIHRGAIKKHHMFRVDCRGHWPALPTWQIASSACHKGISALALWSASNLAQ